MMRYTIAFICIGLVVFTTMATFDVGQYFENWGRVYALWDKGKDCMLVYLVWRLSKKKYGNLFKHLFWLTVVRLSWDCVSWVTGLSVNNPIAVGILFLIYSGYVIYKIFPKSDA